MPKAEFDIATTVLISYLCTASNMTVDGVVALFESFGLHISGGSVTNALKRLKHYPGPYHEELLRKIKEANAWYKDETSTGITEKISGRGLSQPKNGCIIR